MKKLSYFLLGAAGLMLASCSQDDLLSSAGDGNFEIIINLPDDIATRSTFGEGTAPKQLQYAVFEKTAEGQYNYVLANWKDIGTDLTTSLRLNLLSGKSYRLALFAQSDNYSLTEPAYTFNENTQIISVDYSKMNSIGNATDSYDCFFANVDLLPISATYTVNMQRPMAQLNWGTSDLDANQQIINAYGNDGRALNSTFTIKNVPTSFNMLTGETGTETTTVTLPALGVPNIQFYNVDAEPQTFPVNPDVYKYMALQYILVPSTSATYDVQLAVTGNAGTPTKNINISGLPLQANYRTNIYGELLTNESDINIQITPDFGGSNNQAIPWDGKTVTIPDITGETVTISQPSDLAGLAAIVNGTNDQTANTLAGKTIVLENDFDLGGNSIMIGNTTRSSSNTNGNKFQGTIDGGGHTISNLTINYSGNSNDCVGFISNLDGQASLENLNFTNVNINGGNAEQAGIVGIVSGGAKVSNVTVKGGKISSAEAAGGIVGRMIKSGTISGCNNEGTEVSSSKWNVGGIVGAAYYTQDAETLMTITECNNSGTINGQYGVGGIAGLSAANISNCNNTGNVTGTQSSVGGIVGEQKAAGSIKGCTNSGNISAQNVNTDTNYGAAGIVGWVRYATPSESAAYPYQNPIEVSGCTNNGKNISGVTGVGGIVGMWFAAGVCKDNHNYAETITATSNFAAGIVGGSQWIVDSYPSAILNGTLSVTGNTSTTTDSSIKAAGSYATIVYINNSQKTTASGNSPENYNLPKAN